MLDRDHNCKKLLSHIYIIKKYFNMLFRQNNTQKNLMA